MVRCGRCGVDVADSFETCPNCGNNLAQSNMESSDNGGDDLKCSTCGTLLSSEAEFCPKCGTKVEIDTAERCKGCGSEIPEGVLFCPICGNKVEQKKAPQFKRCSNCGFELEEDVTFCPECGTNVMTGKMAESPQASPQDSNQSFADKLNINKILKHVAVSLLASVVLSIIGVLIGFSWLSFIIAIVLVMGFIGGLIDNEANAIVSGFLVGLILGLLENPIIQFCWGTIVARIYEWYFGGQILLLIIIGVIVAYVSNVYLKSRIQNIAGNLASWF